MKKIHFRSGEHSPFLTIFLSGFALGVIYLSIFGRAAVHETTLMSSYFFLKYQQVEFASAELFLYTLKARLSTFTLLWLTGLTVLGNLAACAYLLWLGAALGITVTTAAMKMGLTGILVCAASAMPHFILYVPGLLWILRRICAMSAGRNSLGRYGDRRGPLYSYFLVWLVGVLLFVVGAFLESYVNPLFLKNILKIL